MLTQARRKRAEEALRSPTRREILELLVSAGATGLPAGVIASGLDELPGSVTAHLAALLNAGLVECEIRGCRVRYRADLRHLSDLAPNLVPASDDSVSLIRYPLIDPAVC